MLCGGQLMETSLDLPVIVGAGLYVVNAAAHYLLLRDEGEGNYVEGIPVQEVSTVGPVVVSTHNEGAAYDG